MIPFLFIYIIGLAGTVVVLTLRWISDRDMWPNNSPEAKARFDHKFAVSILRAPLWPWTVLVLAHRAVRWIAINATKRVDQ